jgi:hypothetical protein
VRHRLHQNGEGVLGALDGLAPGRLVVAPAS